MAKIDTLQIAVDTLSNRIDTIESATSIHFVLLLAILGLLILAIGYYMFKELHHRCKSFSKKNKSISQHNEQKSSVERLINILPNLQKELDELRGYKEKAEKHDELENKYDELKKTNGTLEKDNSDLKTELEQKETEIATFPQKLQAKDDEVKNKLAEITEQNKANKDVLEKVKKTDLLKDYATKAFEYLVFAENVLQNTDKQCKKIGNAVMYALLQQAFSVTSELAKWKQICTDIKIGIAVQNQDLKNCFQYEKPDEQLKAFKTLFISQLKPITNALLILCEANCNLSKFGINEKSIENEFINRIESIKSNAKKIGIVEIADVKLFTKIDDNKGAEADSGQISFPYSTVENLNKDDIAEITQFGMQTEFDDSISKTKVLIK
jgi:hypothetical protein